MVKPTIDELAELKESIFNCQTPRTEAYPDMEFRSEGIAIRIHNVYSYEKKTISLSEE
jgi:hypothetical protein